MTKPGVEDLPLFTMARRGAVATSRAAARTIQRTATTLRQRALGVIRAAGAEGKTADEVAAVLEASVLAIRPRIAELHRLGLIRANGQRRANASGLMASVWVAA